MKNISTSKICPILSAKIMSQAKEELPVIVQLRKKDHRLESGIMDLSAKGKKPLPVINGVACNLSTDIIYRLANNPDIDYISFDSKVFTQLDIAVPTIGGYIPQEIGYDGKGVTVAVIDTGVAPHQDLTTPNNRIVGFKDLINNKSVPYDDNGHGTHVSGIIAGNGYSSRGKYIGMAPNSNILSIKALDENGSGSTSKIVEAISYIIETKDEYNTKIVNLSIGTPANNASHKDPLCRAVERAIEAGLIVIVAAGNSGPELRTILSPGINRNVITVGAIDDKRTIEHYDDTIASFSSRGPTLEGVKKPDLLAPGVNINSLSNTKMNGYSTLSGTSMATPLVSGAVALMLNKYGDLNHYEVKKKLLEACIELDSSNEGEDIGVINLKSLFENEEKVKSNNIYKKSKGFSNDLFENIIVILIILFLIDSRI